MPKLQTSVRGPLCRCLLGPTLFYFTGRGAIDKEAASRFITHAITQVKLKKLPVDEKKETASTPGPSAVRVPVKVTGKMMERAQYLQEMQQRDMEEGSEEGSLEVFDETEEDSMDIDAADDASVARRTGKGKEKAGTKRPRIVLDPSGGKHTFHHFLSRTG